MQQPQQFCELQMSYRNPRRFVLPNDLPHFHTNTPASLEIPTLPEYPKSPPIKAPRNRKFKVKENVVLPENSTFTKPEPLVIPREDHTSVPGGGTKGYIRGLKNDIRQLKTNNHELINILRAHNIEVPTHCINGDHL